ncbi:hypothetical protein LLH00_16040 [bacterium]|nr:hypothetical protein [bacterium]
MMRTLAQSLLLLACLSVSAGPAQAQAVYVDVPVNGERALSTVQGVAGLPSAFGSAGDYIAVLRIAPLAPGVKYEATLTYDAGTDIGYSYSLVDGSPFGQDWASFVGIGSGTGTRELAGKQEKLLFTIDPQSTSNTMYLVLRTNKPFNCRWAFSNHPSGVTKDSQDRWGYYYVSDFDDSHRSPFLLKRGSAVAVAQPQQKQGPWVEIPVNGEKTATTAQGLTGLPSGFGSAEDYMVVLRLAPLKPGVRYEATLTFDAGTDIGYGYSLVDGDPFQSGWASFVGTGTGTGTREMKDKQQKILFTVDPKSTSNALYLPFRTNKPFTFRFSITDTPSGVTPASQDRWGYYYVDDLDADHYSPFLLKNSTAAEAPVQPVQKQGPWVEIPVGGEKTVTTAQGLTGLPSGFGSAEEYMVVLRLAPLRPGVRYEGTLTFDAGTDIGYGYALVDGDPFLGDWFSFVGSGTGTGTREMKDKQQKILFTVDPKSTSSALYLPFRTNKPFTFRYAISDKPSGVTPASQDPWGYYYVDDLDVDHYSPFLLQR